MILPTVKALAVVCWIMCVRNAASQARLPAPSFSFSHSVDANEIQLSSKVRMNCEAPSRAPYPVTVFVGRLDSPSQTPETTQAWTSYYLLKSGSYVYFDINAVATTEGKIVCWYKSNQTEVKNPYSEFSSPLTLFISSIPAPNVTVVPSFPEGGNYTICCNSTAGTITNFTMSLYYRILPATPGTDWTLYGSKFLTNSTNIYLTQTDVAVSMEYTCNMKMFYNGKVLSSTMHKSQPVYREYYPVRLWEKERGKSCLGFLEVKVQEKWEPVCKKEVGITPDSSSVDAMAKVVCRELGCGTVLLWKKKKINRSYSRTVDVDGCTGDEKKLKDCQMNTDGSCGSQTLYIICSDALPPPTLSVKTYGSGSTVYVKDKEDVDIFCSINSTYIKYDSGYYIFKKDGIELSRVYTYPVDTRSITKAFPEQKGQYECVFRLSLSDGPYPESPPSNTVFIYIYNPPHPLPIVLGVLTTVFGLAILVYICVYRTTEVEVQDNAFSGQSQDPETQTNAENLCYNGSLPQQM